MIEWDEAISQAKEELGYYEDEYIEDWDKVIEEAQDIFDYEKEEEYRNFCINAHNKYQGYLKSNRWKKIREEVFVRDNFICKDCGEIATEVHHTDYDFLWTEKEKDFCISVCNKCHKKIHKIIEEENE